MRSSMVLLATAVFAAAGAAQAANVTVLRGDSMERISTDRAGVTVLRGGGSMLPNPPKESAEAPRAAIYAGDTLWYVGPAGRIQACYLVQTEYARLRSVRCSAVRE